MPAKNSVKNYISGGWYHLYNRGVEKRMVFLDKQDYAVFEKYLSQYLLPKDEDLLRQKMVSSKIYYKEKDEVRRLLSLNNFSISLNCIAYSLMPNHFHFLVKQTEAQTIDSFMNSLCTRYAVYFNKKYKRVGILFQDTYKAVLVTSDEQLLYLTKYIHRNVPKLSLQGDVLRAQLIRESKNNSYLHYLGIRKIPWIHADEILSFFSQVNPSSSYERFVSESFSEVEATVMRGSQID